MPRACRGAAKLLLTVYAPQEAVQRQQEEQTAERFRALRDADDRFGLERMQRPEQGRQKGERARRRAKAPAQHGAGQRPPHHAQQGERRQRVNRHIQRVIAPYVFAADRMVQCVGEIHDRPARRGAPVGGRGQHVPGREASDGRVVHDGADIVKEEGRMQAVPVCARHGDENPDDGQPALGRWRCRAI